MEPDKSDRLQPTLARATGGRIRSLVTGGAGFIGSHLCERLLADGHEVLCVDNFYSTSKANIEHLLDNPRFELMRHDVTFPLYVEVDEIYHLACPASPIHYQRDPVQTTKTSVHGSINMLGLAKRLKARILLTSTSEVYGDPSVHPQTEDYWGNVNPIGPRSCYDEGKRCAETLFFDYHRQHDLDIKVIRLFNTYGPRMQPDDGRVVSNFIMQALAGEPLTIYGTGDQTRSFCHVDDTVEALVRMMATEHGVTGPINIGNPHEIPVSELADRVIALVGSNQGVQHLPLPADDPHQRQPDITRARESLDWKPTVDLADGLPLTVAWFTEVYGDASEQEHLTDPTPELERERQRREHQLDRALPPGDPRRDVPALPADPDARWRWLVGELDAARGQAGAPQNRRTHPDDVTDPHEHGGTHALADAQLRESTDSLVRLLRQVALSS